MLIYVTATSWWNCMAMEKLFTLVTMEIIMWGIIIVVHNAFRQPLMYYINNMSHSFHIAK